MSLKILVVDDEPDIRLLLSDILQDEGYIVDLAEHAEQANAKLHIFKPDLVLLDIWMPDIDGVTLLKQWSEKGLLNCQVIMMSGHGTVETAVEATRYGAFDFVEKPLSIARLLHTVKSAFSNQKRAVDNDLLVSELPVGNSDIIQKLRETVKSLADSHSPVFLSGPLGSGIDIWINYLLKEQNSNLPIKVIHNDFESYLHDGSSHIFIPEIITLNVQSQQKLLTAINRESENTSPGRLFVASHLSHEMLRKGSEVVPELADFWNHSISIPSLNAHIEDIPELVEYYVDWLNKNEGLPYRHFGVAAQNSIRNHHWVGELVQLKSFLRLVLSNSSEDDVALTEIQNFFEGSDTSIGNNNTEKEIIEDGVLKLTVDLGLDLREAREYFEREYLKAQLTLCNDNVAELARKVGQERTNIYRKLKMLGLGKTR